MRKWPCLEAAIWVLYPAGKVAHEAHLISDSGIVLSLGIVGLDIASGCVVIEVFVAFGGNMDCDVDRGLR